MKSAGKFLKQELVRVVRECGGGTSAFADRAVADRAKARLDRDMVVSTLLPLCVNRPGPR
jgi:hypothetical protein